jgi:hypothetical protein
LLKADEVKDLGGASMQKKKKKQKMENGGGDRGAEPRRNGWGGAGGGRSWSHSGGGGGGGGGGGALEKLRSIAALLQDMRGHMQPSPLWTELVRRLGSCAALTAQAYGALWELHLLFFSLANYSPDEGVCKTVPRLFFSNCHCTKASVCQDRLGTDVEEY